MATAAAMTSYIKALGRSYEDLLSSGVVPAIKPWKIFEQDDQFHLDIEPGLGLSFHEGTKRLESISIALLQVVPNRPAYRGELPQPFASHMEKPEVRRQFGEPHESQGPTSLPKPIGKTGGWDAYELNEATHPNAVVEFQYTADLAVKALVFSLADKGRN